MSDLEKELRAEREVNRQLLEMNHGLRGQVDELRLRVDDLTERDMRLALGREEASSLILRTFRTMIRERRLLASVAAASPDNVRREHACGGVFYLDELDGALVGLWMEARKGLKRAPGG